MGGKVLVWVYFHVLVCSGVCTGVLDTPFVMKGEGWVMSATCVPWYVPRGDKGLSRHGDPIAP